MVSILEQQELAVEKESKKRWSGVKVVLIQSVCCVLLLAFFWLYKIVGGDSYLKLRDSFHQALQNNALFATMSEIFSERQPNESEIVGSETISTTAGIIVG